MEYRSLLVVACLMAVSLAAEVTEDNCEVCVKMLTRFEKTVPSEDKGDSAKIQQHFKKFCKDSKGKDNSLCYYVGGLETSATNIMNTMTKPLSWSMPINKVCEKLRSADSQICDLKYEKIIDLKTANFKKLKVKELKKILDSWGESCSGCTEKKEYVDLVKEKMKIYDPEAHKVHAAKEEL